MPRAWFAIPGDLSAPTGGYAYARRLISACSARGWHLDHVPLPGTFPLPTGEDHDWACAKLAELAPDRPILVDGLAFGALSDRFLARTRRPWIALVHHPLALEAGLSAEASARLRRSETAALSRACAVIVTSPATARCLTTDFGVQGERITVAPPGTDAAARARGSGAVPLLLSVGTITPRKGYDLLVEALASIEALPWRSLIVGSLTRDPRTAAALQQLIPDRGLGDRVVLAGAVDQDTLDGFYAEADVFVLASRYEGYGMVFAEALARGLPVVGCAAGAVPETIPDAAGILVRPDSAADLAEALTVLLSRPEVRRTMAEAAWKHARDLPTWNETAARVTEVLETVDAR